MSVHASLLRTIALVLDPLHEALSSPTAGKRLFKSLGYNVTLTPEAHTTIGNLLPVLNVLESLPDLLVSLDESSNTGEVIGELIEATGLIVQAIEHLSELEAENIAELPGSLSLQETWSDIATALPDHLLGEYLKYNEPVVFSVFRILGLCVSEGSGQAPRYRFLWDRLGASFSDPTNTVKALIGWNDNFQSWPLQRELSGILARFGAQVYIRPLTQSVAEAMAGELVETPAGTQTNAILFSQSDAEGELSELGITMAFEPENGGTIFIGNLASGASELEVQVSEDWRLVAGGDLDGTATRGVRIQPTGVTLVGGAAALGTHIALEGTPDTPWVLIGSTGGTRIELEKARVEVGIAGTTSEPDGYFLARIEDGAFRVIIELGNADGFLKTLIGSALPEIAAGGELRWGTQSGISFGGGIGLEVTLLIGKQLGPIYIDSLTVGIGASEAGAAFFASTVANLELGPFTVSVDGIGASFELARGTDGSQFANLDAQLRFVSPRGLGLAIDIGPVSGGGYLDLDAENGEYAGTFEAELFDVGVTVVGIIMTQFPDNPDGWSMFLSLSATFTGLQIGFGFTLNGVGGLIGVNRGLDEEALADGVRSGALDSILFPEDVVANAPRILADMAAVFPPAEGQFVFGPVVKLGWGTPTLIEADVGVIVQLPEPFTITLLGALESLLPTDDAPIVELRVDVAGTINFTEGTLSVDASLRGSKVAGLSLNGDMALRASFLNNPSFLFSFGGFHPAFTPPPGFPKLERLAVGFDTGDNLSITLGGYFAVSSSTLQFGAFCELWARAVGFTAEGGTSFDALIIFKPFGFIISMNFWVSISAGGVELFGVLLAGSLKGPNRWHVSGLATFKLLGVKKSLDVDARFGRAEEEEPREAINVEGLLVEALRDPGAWQAAPPIRDASGVVLVESDSELLRVHPSGAIELRQRIVPLQRRIDQYGNATVVGSDEFVLEQVRLGPKEIESVDVEEWFAAAQYWAMSDAERLSAPSFELMPAGLRLEGGGVTAGEALPFTPDYEVKVRDPSVQKKGSAKAASLFTARALKQRSSTSTKSEVSSRRKIGPTIAEVSYTDMDIETGRPVGKAAHDRYYVLRDRIQRSESSRARTVVPAYELEIDS